MTIETAHLPSVVVKKHFFDVPLNYEVANGKTITLFARELVAPNYSDRQDLPWMLFLQGGPGYQSPRPEGRAAMWMPRALKDYRVLLLDQRGTGLSTPVSHQSLSALESPAAQADYLKCFRADSIVKDCEAIRQKLTRGAPWTVLGQSFGGFCLTTYLSMAPQGISGAILTGGLPPLCTDPDPVYRATYKHLLKKNEQFYQRYPQDIERVHVLIEHLNANPCHFPSGERLTPRRFLQVGLLFGFFGGFEKVHYLLEDALVKRGGNLDISYKFTQDLSGQLSFNTNPLYAILHEAIYCQGKSSRWSAERILGEFHQFGRNQSPLMFTGEMIYRWMFDEYESLIPLKAAAEILADETDWPDLYNPAVLTRNSVPTVALIYHDDMYVDRDLSQQCASTINGIKLWITNEYEHDGIRVAGETILDRLLSMLAGSD